MFSKEKNSLYVTSREENLSTSSHSLRKTRGRERLTILGIEKRVSLYILSVQKREHPPEIFSIEKRVLSIEKIEPL